MCCFLQEEYDLQGLLPVGYLEGVPERLSAADFAEYMAAGAYQGSGAEHDEDNAEGVDGVWHEVRRQPACDRNSLWRLWLQGCAKDSSQVQRLLQDYEVDPEGWQIDPWTVQAADRVDLACKCDANTHCAPLEYWNAYVSTLLAVPLP